MTITSDQLVEGSTIVAINPQSDRTRKIIFKGVVDKLLTKATEHPHGLLVQLETGEIGRVKEVLNDLEVQTEPVGSGIPEVIENIEDIIAEGENHFVEFKTSCLWSQALNRDAILQKKITQFGTATSKVIIAKSIAGFLNSDGGNLVVGVKEVKDTDEIEIVGINTEIPKLKDKTLDGYRRMLLDSIVKVYLPSFVLNRIIDYIQISFHTIGENTVCLLKVSKSGKRVFLKLHSEDAFMVRIDASTRQIIGEDLVEYCVNRF
tara:strand:+ start:395 stop:1180 length:786 start_codon:yes stop_codon:yes gene_type:complete